MKRAAFALLVAFPLQAAAADFTGKVSLPDGRAAFGAMVTVFDSSRQLRDTVYTDAQGRFALRTDIIGEVKARARLAGFDDATLTLTAGALERVDLNFALKPFRSPADASDALAASAFNARLQWESAADRQVFVSQCNYCHQLGNATTRVPASHAEWRATIDKMEAILAMPTQREKDRLAAVLSRGFDGKPVDAKQDYGASETLVRAKWREWNVGDDYTFVHDADLALDGKLYGADEGHDLLWVLDRESGTIEKYAEPDIDLPRGGRFSGMKLPIGVFSGKHGPHSMAQTRDGRIWITNALSSTLASFDPATKQFKLHPLGPDVLYPHTIRVDENDIVWFTCVASNQVVRFDPKTEEATIIALPAGGIVQWVSLALLPTLMHVGSWVPNQAAHLNFSTHRIFGHSVLPFPYGIDVNPKDGSIWYAKLFASRIGRIDPKTLQVEEWDTPMRGPRRPRFDASGILWIPAFDDSGLMRFDAEKKTFETFRIPPVGTGEYETPYALNIAKNGDIWMAANNSDRILRFVPATRTFFSYPSPTRVTVLRDFTFDGDGVVCSSSSNLPSYAIEGGRGGFLCLDPQGGLNDRHALGLQ